MPIHSLQYTRWKNQLVISSRTPAVGGVAERRGGVAQALVELDPRLADLPARGTIGDQGREAVTVVGAEPDEALDGEREALVEGLQAALRAELEERVGLEARLLRLAVLPGADGGLHAVERQGDEVVVRLVGRLRPLPGHDVPQPVVDPVLDLLDVAGGRHPLGGGGGLVDHLPERLEVRLGLQGRGATPAGQLVLEVGEGGDFSIARETIEDTKESHGELSLVDGYLGGQVVTKINLRNYLLWFEKHIPLVQQEGVRVINATEGGAKIHAATQMTLAAATAQFLGDPLPIHETIAKLAIAKPLDTSLLLHKLDRTQKALLELIKYTHDGKKYASEVFELLGRANKPVEKINQLVHKIDRLEKRIAKIAAEYDRLLSAVAGKDLFALQTIFNYEGLSTEESLRLNMRQTATMYQGLQHAAQNIRKKLTQLAEIVAEAEEPTE
ncbi:MAG: hypothetical protein NTV51_30560 [Verrucomicrobia bacterium]|nr:hypothetical protein [Verrucomicrobiota bacterium]